MRIVIDSFSGSSAPDGRLLGRRTVVKAVGTAAGLSLVSLPSAAAASSVSGFTGSGYATGSTADAQFRFAVDGTLSGSRTVELAFARTSYIPGADQLTATVNWGDGTSATSHSSVTNSLTASHTYLTTGTYTVTVTGLNAGIGINFGSSSAAGYLTDVLSWSNIGSLEYGFNENCPRLASVPNVLPIGVLSLKNAFQDCYALNCPLNGWNTSYVTTMEGTFLNATTFNQNIGAWDLSSCTSIRSIFKSASAFNNGGSNSINNWNTSQVTDMFQAFNYAPKFNQPIGGWDTSMVTSMYAMFVAATDFNNGGSSNINNWNTSKVTDMTAMFQAASSFNQPIGSWDTREVTTMSNMFENAYSFNHAIGGWNTSKVTTMYAMFNRDTTPPMAFDQNISGWNVNNVTNKGAFVNTESGSTANYQSTWLANERPAGFPSFN